MDFITSKRMKVSLITGAALGVICIIGALIRHGGSVGVAFLFALWFNRLLMGMVIGAITEKPAFSIVVIRGALMGLIVSFAFWSATGFGDVVSFLAGIVYGIIIEIVARKYAV